MSVTDEIGSSTIKRSQKKAKIAPAATAAAAVDKSVAEYDNDNDDIDDDEKCEIFDRSTKLTAAQQRAQLRSLMSEEDKKRVRDKAADARKLKRSLATPATAVAANAARQRLRDAHTPAKQAETLEKDALHRQTARASQDQVDKNAVKEQNKAQHSVQRASLSPLRGQRQTFERLT